jgi:hypothetical protein
MFALWTSGTCSSRSWRFSIAQLHVLMIGHAQIKSFQDPDLASAYDRYQLKINDKAAALVREALTQCSLPV